MLAQYVVTEGAVFKGEAEWTSRVDTNQGTVEGCAAPNTHIGQGHVAGEPAGSMARLGLRHADIRSMPLVPGIHHHMLFYASSCLLWETGVSQGALGMTSCRGAVIAGSGHTHVLWRMSSQASDLLT